MDDLTQLKGQILDDLIVIVDETDVEPIDKFDILMLRYVNTGDAGLLSRLYEVTKTIPDPTERGSALMKLFEEINVFEAENAIPAEAAPAPVTEAPQIDAIAEDTPPVADNQTEN